MIGGDDGPVLEVRRRERPTSAPRVSRTFGTANESGSKRPRLLVKMEAFSTRFGTADIDVRARVNGALRSVMARNRRVRPSYSETFVAPNPPNGAKEAASYQVGAVTVRIHTLPNETEGFYLVEPPEYRSTTPEVALVEKARKRLLDEAPVDMQVETPAQVRQWVERRGDRDHSRHGPRLPAGQARRAGIHPR